MAFQYKRIESRTAKDEAIVNRMINAGWKAISIGIFTVLLEKHTKQKGN